MSVMPSPAPARGEAGEPPGIGTRSGITRWSRRELLQRAAFFPAALARNAALSPTAGALRRLERSFWIHATLADDTRRGYWGPGFPEASPASADAIQNAAHILSGPYAANRIYLLYHHECPLNAAGLIYAYWRRVLHPGVELVPTLLLRMYDANQSRVFSRTELAQLVDLLMTKVRPRHLAVYDVYAGRDMTEDLQLLASRCPAGLIRIGLQPGEALAPPFVGAVEDTWSALCNGKTNELWLGPGYGAGVLRKWVQARANTRLPIAWDLVTVAWDYGATKDGSYPGYDDAARNMPLPPQRNTLAVRLVLREASKDTLAGFSSDLVILQANSRVTSRDGARASLYALLRQGRRYRGYFAAPLNEIASVYRTLAQGVMPGRPPD